MGKAKYTKFEIIEDIPEKPKRKPRSLPLNQREMLVIGAMVGLVVTLGLALLLEFGKTHVPLTWGAAASTPNPTPVLVGERVEDIAWSGNQIAVAGSSTLRLYKNGILSNLLEGYNFDNANKDQHVAITFNHQGTELAALTTYEVSGAEGVRSAAAQLTIWDVASRAIKRTVTAHDDGVTDFYFGMALAYSADDSLLATGAGDGHVVVWDAATGERRATLNTNAKGTLNIAFAPDGKHLTITNFGDEFYPPDDYRGSQTFWSITNLEDPVELTGVASIGACVVFPLAVSVDGRYWTDNLMRDCQRVDEIRIWEIYGDTIYDTYGGAWGVGGIRLGDNWSSSQIEAITFNQTGDLLAFVHRRTPQPAEESGTLPVEEIDLQVFRLDSGFSHTAQHIATNSEIPRQGVSHLHFMNDHQGTWVQYVSAADNSLWQWNIETDVTAVMRF